MKIHTPNEFGTWSAVVLDQHQHVHEAERPTPHELRLWMEETSAEAFFIPLERWQDVVSTVNSYGVARVETGFDCDVVVWRNTTERDYTLGDPPVNTGTVVRYHGSSGAPGLYEVLDHRPVPDADKVPGDPAEHYPDGVSYDLWPVGVVHRFGNRHLAVYQVRRRSFTVNTG